MFDFLARPWLMDPHRAEAYRRTAAALLASGAALNRPEKKSLIGDGRALFARAGDVAVIQVCGPLYAGEDWFAEMCGWCSYQNIIAAVEAAADDLSVSSIVFEVNCPGGEASGITELYNAVVKAKASKRCIAVSRNLMCSAAYIALCACDEIVLTPTSETGSVGTYFTLQDSSKYFEELGIRVVTPASGDLKTAGVPGTALTDDQVAMFKASVDEHFDWIVSVVALNRGMSDAEVRGMRGAFYPAKLAVKNKLGDRVAEWADVVAEEMVGVVGEMESGSPANPGESTPDAEPGSTEDPMDLKSMTIEELAKARPDLLTSIKAQGVSEAAEKPATIAELKAAFPGDSDFVLEQAEKSATLSAAKVAHAGVLKLRLEARDAELKAANEKLAKAPTAPALAIHRGRESALAIDGEDGKGGDSGAGNTYEAKLAAKAAEISEKDKVTLRIATDRAHSIVAKEFPKLHKDWLAAGAGINARRAAELGAGR